MISCNKPVLTMDDIDAVADLMMTGKIAGSDIAYSFESDFGDFIESNLRPLAFANQTVAMDAFFSMTLLEGDEVIVTPFTFHSVIFAILRNGGIPVFIDLDDNSIFSRWDVVDDLITDRTAAIVVTHLFGQYDDVDLTSYPLSIVHDCAQSIGVFDMYGGRLGSSRCENEVFFYSMYATKNITSCEGGMFITNEHRIHCEMQNLRDNDYAYSPGGIALGSNYRLSGIHAALGQSQLSRVDQINSMRYSQALYYDYLLDIKRSVDLRSNVFHQYSLLLDDECDVGQLIQEMELYGISLGRYYGTLAYEYCPVDTRMINDDSCPNAERMASRIVQLPLGPAMYADSLEYVVEKFLDIYGGGYYEAI